MLQLEHITEVARHVEAIFERKPAARVRITPSYWRSVLRAWLNRLRTFGKGESGAIAFLIYY